MKIFIICGLFIHVNMCLYIHGFRITIRVSSIRGFGFFYWIFTQIGFGVPAESNHSPIGSGPFRPVDTRVVHQSSRSKCNMYPKKRAKLDQRDRWRTGPAGRLGHALLRAAHAMYPCPMLMLDDVDVKIPVFLYTYAHTGPLALPCQSYSVFVKKKKRTARSSRAFEFLAKRDLWKYMSNIFLL